MTLSSNYTKSYATFTPLKKVARLVTIISGKIGTLRHSKPAKINRGVGFHSVFGPTIKFDHTTVIYRDHPYAALWQAWTDYASAKRRRDTRAMHTTHKALVKARADILEASRNG